MYIVDVLLTILRGAAGLATELFVRVPVSTEPSQEEISKAIDSFVETMLVDKRYPRLAKWIEEHQQEIIPETIGVFRVQ